MRSKSKNLAALALLIVALEGCSGTDFGSSSGKAKGAEKSSSPDKKNANKPEKNKGKSTKDGAASDADKAGEQGAPGSDGAIEDEGDILPEGQSDAADGSRSDGFFQGDTDSSLGEVEVDANEITIKVPRFAMLVNDLKCGMCHTTVNGDVSSTADVSDWSALHAPASEETVNGGWFAARSWTNATTGLDYNVKVLAGVTQTYTGNMVPNDPVSKTPAFPIIDFVAAEARMAGRLTGSSVAGGEVVVDKIAEGNMAMVGTAAKPIVIEGSVMIKGDLVIKGVYTGLGTIYVTGNIYIPADLKAVNSVFPFPTEKLAAQAKGRELVKSKQGDGLGLATAKSVLIADLTTGIYDHGLTPPTQKRDVLGIDNVYNWFPGGKTGYQGLYEPSLNCGNQAMEARSSFNLVEAYIYAKGSIGGISRKGSWAINGGVITDVLHVLGTGAIHCDETVSSVHQMPQNTNYINYDFRMSAGMRILGELAPYFN